MQAIKLSELTTNRKRRNEPSIDDGGENGSDSEIDISSTDSEEDEGMQDGDEEVINVDFDFFDGNPEVDFHSFKNLLRQLLGPQESQRVQLSALADLLLESPTTTIKTDGKDSDPYCFMSIIDYKEKRDADYVKYLHKVDTKLNTFFETIDNQANKKCAIVLSERLINMPPEVIPPLYRITMEDAKSNGDGKDFDFYVITSRKYEVNFDLDEDDDEFNGKKSSGSIERSRKRTKGASEIDYFHEEDRFFEKHVKIMHSSEPRKGLINTYMILDHEGLVMSIKELENEMQNW